MNLLWFEITNNFWEPACYQILVYLGMRPASSLIVLLNLTVLLGGEQAHIEEAAVRKGRKCFLPTQ